MAFAVLWSAQHPGASSVLTEHCLSGGVRLPAEMPRSAIGYLRTTLAQPAPLPIPGHKTHAGQRSVGG